MKLETLEKQLAKKNEAIAKRVAITKKHAKRYLKDKNNFIAHSNMKDSCKTLASLLRERKGILKDIEIAKANVIVLPPLLAQYRYDLTVSLYQDRHRTRETLKEIAEEKRAVVKAWKDRGISNAYTLVSRGYSMGHRRYDPKPGLSEEDLAIAKDYIKMSIAEDWLNDTFEKRNEKDEHIGKRSADDAKDLVEDLYKRVTPLTGEVTDYTGLHIDRDNMGYAVINGIVKGTKGGAKVQSIGAGGYNIQCWHIRLLVNPYKI